jgi:hypothetical protein
MSESIRTSMSKVAFFVGLPPSVEEACRSALTNDVGIVALSDASVAGDVVLLARPQLVVGSSAVSAADRAVVNRLASDFGARIIWVPPQASETAIGVLVGGAAEAAFHEPSPDSVLPPSTAA